MLLIHGNQKKGGAGQSGDIVRGHNLLIYIGIMTTEFWSQMSSDYLLKLCSRHSWKYIMGSGFGLGVGLSFTHLQVLKYLHI